MTKRVGNVRLPGKEMRYYVQGDHKLGYRIRIVTLHTTEEISGPVSESLHNTIKIAKKIARGAVFPENLEEILEEFKIDNHSH